MSRTLKPEDQIAQYRVVSPLGAGGMGEVYIAQDQTLERSVALKILPPDLVQNQERVSRFVREAKSASSLSHPNIVTIYEIGHDTIKSEGDDSEVSDPIHFISMELVTGETLRDKIHTEKADLKTLLGYLAQAAEGVAKAHAAGIVHRDLKPSNIMISRDDYAKVLDFGLAKLTEREATPEEATLAVTTPPDITDDGVVLGTVGYMSPEQVRGKSVDHRSDIFSFGCILYEAATRQRPFTADSNVETMHKILHDAPEPVESLNAEAPRAVRRLIKRCLARNPEQRLQSMKDLAIELREIVDEYDSLSPSGSSSASVQSAAVAAVESEKRRGMNRLFLAAIVAVGLAGAIYGISSRMRDSGSETTVSSAPATLTTTSVITDPALVEAVLSPDGRFLAYVSRRPDGVGLWVRQVATGSDVEIVAPSREFTNRLSFSVDGNYLYFLRSDPDSPNYSAVFEVPSLGGTPRKRLFDVDSAISFSPDGKQVCFRRGMPQDGVDALVIATLATGEERILAKTEPTSFMEPAWSPSGEKILAAQFETLGQAKLVTVDVTSGEIETFVDNWVFFNSCAWLPDETGVVFAGMGPAGNRAQLWRASYPDGDVQNLSNNTDEYFGVGVSAADGAIVAQRQARASSLWTIVLEPGAQPIQRTRGSARASSVGDFTATGDGTIVVSMEKEGKAHLFVLDDDGSAPRQITSGGTSSFEPLWVQGTNRILFNQFDGMHSVNVWRIDIDGGNLTQLTHESAAMHRNQILASGSVVCGTLEGNPKVYLAPIEGGEVQLVRESGGEIGEAYEYSPDEKFVLTYELRDLNGRSRTHMIVLSAETGEEVAVLVLNPASGRRWAPGSDGLTVIQDLDGSCGLFHVPLDGGATVPLLRASDGVVLSHRWSPDGSQVMLRIRKGRVANIWVASASGEDLRSVTDFRTGTVFRAEWAPDGESILFTHGNEERDIVLMRE